MKSNEGPIDRIVRGVVGAILLAFAAFSLEGPIDLIEGGIALGIGILGTTTLLTGLIGWCAAFALLGIDTCPPSHPAAGS
jgi:hypothetical protein